MTRDEKLQKLASYLNANLDVPLLPEWTEQKLCEWLMRSLSPVLTEDLLDVMLSITDGLSDQEIEFYTLILLHYLDFLIDIPFVSDETEVKWTNQIAELVLRLLRPGYAAAEDRE